MIIPVASASVLIKVLVQNGMINVKFGEQTQLKGMKIKNMICFYSGTDDLRSVDFQERFVTIKKGVEIHFDKFPLKLMEAGNYSDMYALTSDKSIDWANSYIEWANALSGVPLEGKYITFLVFYEKA